MNLYIVDEHFLGGDGWLKHQLVSDQVPWDENHNHGPPFKGNKMFTFSMHRRIANLREEKLQELEIQVHIWKDNMLWLHCDFFSHLYVYFKVNTFNNFKCTYIH